MFARKDLLSMIDLLDLHTHTTVSYTHLDVYKRQGYLLHYLGLSHSRGTDKQHRPLPDGWYDILPILIL